MAASSQAQADFAQALTTLAGTLSPIITANTTPVRPAFSSPFNRSSGGGSTSTNRLLDVFSNCTGKCTSGLFTDCLYNYHLVTSG